MLIVVYTGEKKREYDREWFRKRKLKNPEYQSTYLKRLRLRVLEKLGGRCIYCGCDIPEALEINHKDKERKKQDKSKYGTVNNKSFFFKILNGKRKTDDLELTCRICNAWYYLVKDKNIYNGWKIIWNDSETSSSLDKDTERTI